MTSCRRSTARRRAGVSSFVVLRSTIQQRCPSSAEHRARGSVLIVVVLVRVVPTVVRLDAAEVGGILDAARADVARLRGIRTNRPRATGPWRVGRSGAEQARRRVIVLDPVDERAERV